MGDRGNFSNKGKGEADGDLIVRVIIKAVFANRRE